MLIWMLLGKLRYAALSTRAAAWWAAEKEKQIEIFKKYVK
jgi:hypothetical protein